jgi:hypothetical protein
METTDSGALNWRLSAHPITLLCYLGFRIGNHVHCNHPSTLNPQPALIMALQQEAYSCTSSASSSSRTCQRTSAPTHPLSTRPHVASQLTNPSPTHSVLVFILTLLLLSLDFYYLKNIAGRRLVGLRWWNEVNTSTGDSHWVFESAEPGSRAVNATDRRFFWLSMYAAPALWVALAVLALVRLLNAIWLVIVGECCLPGVALLSFG